MLLGGSNLASGHYNSYNPCIDVRTHLGHLLSRATKQLPSGMILQVLNVLREP